MANMDVTSEPTAKEEKPPETAEAARDAHSSRVLLVRRLVDIVVLPSGRISGNERSLTADIILQVLEQVEAELRIEVAKRVAHVPECPPALLRALLLDEPEVAEPILRDAEHLPEALLIEAAQKGRHAHRNLIVRRFDLSTSIADIIVDKNEPDICKLILRLDGLTLSPYAVDILVSRSLIDRELQSLLLRRSELEPVHGFMMFWWVDAERRKRVLVRFALDRRVIQDALGDLYPRVFRSKTPPDPIVKEILILAERRHRPRGVDGEIVSMDVVKKTLAVAVDDSTPETIEAVAMIAGISRDLASRVLHDPGGEPFAVMCKSLGVPRQDFFAFLTESQEAKSVSRNGTGKDEQQAEELLAVFDSMARDFARAVLRYWDWNGNPRIVHINSIIDENLN